jgi:hypothetical protein
MNFTIKYDIGQHFWVPRCKKRVHEEEKEINGEVWVRTYFTYEPYAKEKEIVSCEIRHGTNGTGIIYGVLTVNETAQLSTFYPEANIVIRTKEEAEAIANKAASNFEELH